MCCESDVGWYRKASASGSLFSSPFVRVPAGFISSMSRVCLLFVPVSLLSHPRWRQAVTAVVLPRFVFYAVLP